MSSEPAPPYKFTLGLVVGKFSPLHLGHEWLIEQAARRCHQLLILSYAKPEFVRCEAGLRRRWLAARFPQHDALVIDDAWLQGECARLGVTVHPIPSNDASDEVQQLFLAWLLGRVLQRFPDAVFCSENYGTACAELLTNRLGHRVDAVVVDLDRIHVPVSATQIRRDPNAHRDWMNCEVAAAFVRRIALLGGESSGKTTLAVALADHFETVCVAEYGRELWEQQSGSLCEEDLTKIGREQIQREDTALRSANRFLFCDTSPLTTAGYGIWMFGRIDPTLAALAARTYDAIVLCRGDFPFVQDGTRRDENFRLQQYTWYQEQLAARQCPVMEASGNVAQRVASIAPWLSTTFSAPIIS